MRPDAAVVEADGEPRDSRLGPRVQIGPYSFNPPDATICVRRGSRQDGNQIDFVVYGCGPAITGITTQRDPTYRIHAEVEYAAVTDPVAYLDSIVRRLSNAPAHMVFRNRQQQELKTETINGLEFKGYQFELSHTHMTRTGFVYICPAPNHVLKVIGFSDDSAKLGCAEVLKLALHSFRSETGPALPLRLTTAERKRITERTEVPGPTSPIDPKKPRPKLHEVDLSPDPKLLAQLGLEEQFGFFALRRPTNLNLTKLTVADATGFDYCWIYTRPGTDQQLFSLGIYLFTKRNRENEYIDLEYVELAKHQFGKLDLVREMSVYETGKPNGLLLYTRSGTVNGQHGPSTLVYYLAQNRYQTIYVIAVAKDAADLHLLDTVGRTLRAVKPGEVLPMTPHSVVRTEPRQQENTGPLEDDAPVVLTPDLQRLDLLEPELRFGAFALRLPKSLKPVPLPLGTFADTWVWGEYDDARPLTTQHSIGVYLHSRPIAPQSNATSGSIVMRHAEGATIKWNYEQSGFTTLNGQRVHYAVGQITGLDFFEMRGEIMAITCNHEGCMITVVVVSPDTSQSPETYQLLQAAMLSLRPAKPEEALPTPPRSFEVRLAAP